jgi:hypothetical protein
MKGERGGLGRRVFVFVFGLFGDNIVLDRRLNKVQLSAFSLPTPTGTYRPNHPHTTHTATKQTHTTIKVPFTHPPTNQPTSQPTPPPPHNHQTNTHHNRSTFECCRGSCQDARCSPEQFSFQATPPTRVEEEEAEIERLLRTMAVGLGGEEREEVVEEEEEEGVGVGVVGGLELELWEPVVREEEGESSSGGGGGAAGGHHHRGE